MPSRAIAVLGLSVVSSIVCLAPATARAQTPGQNVNMVSGTTFPGGDPFQRQQNEPSVAVSSRNPMHLVAGANDYRFVDVPFSEEFPGAELKGDAWLGLFKSLDGGRTWRSTLLWGFPQDTSALGKASPLKGYTRAADPTVRAGTHGLFYYSGIAFNGTNSAVFVARLMDLDNRENGDVVEGTDPIRPVGVTIVDTGNTGQFLDKPWIAVDKPRGSATCTITVPAVGERLPGGGLPALTPPAVPAGAVYLVWSRFTGAVSTKIMLSRSSDCGKTWSTPIKLSESNGVNQGTTIAIDPGTGAVYVAWRRFAASNQGDAIMFAKSVDGGKTFTRAQEIRPIAPGLAFDQPTTRGTFRTNTLPSIAVSVTAGGASRVHVAWTERVATTSDARLHMLTSADAGSTWGGLALVDDVPIEDDQPKSFARGGQFMPQVTFAGGKLMVLYYDQRLDHTIGIHNPQFPFPPNFTGPPYTEARMPLVAPGATPDTPENVFTKFVDDAQTGLTIRHTIDVRVAQADVNAGGPLSFTSARVSRYRFGIGIDLGTLEQFGTLEALEQLEFNAPNLPMFQNGSVPFMGDYIDLAGEAFLPPDPASPDPAARAWRFNTAPQAAPVFHAVWTSNQDVIAPFDDDWSKYTPPQPSTTSVFDPSQTTPACDAEESSAGTRNQNIYTSRITQGLVVSSPQNSKPLSATLERAFVVLAENTTGVDRAFRLRIRSNAQEVRAAWVAAASGATCPAPPSDAEVCDALDVAIAARSGIARSVFATATQARHARASITVDVEEIDQVGGSPVTQGLASFLVLNADGTVPPLINPEETPGDISLVELYRPSLSTSDVGNPNDALTNANIRNANIRNINIRNANIRNANIRNINIRNVNIRNANIRNANIRNANVADEALVTPDTAAADTTVSEVTYLLTNDGNTTHSYHIRIVGEEPSGVALQLIVAKPSTAITTFECELFQVSQDQTLVAVADVPVLAPGALFDPNIPDPAVSNATVALAPGESVFVILRGAVGLQRMSEIAAEVIPVVVPHAGTEIAAPLFITSGAGGFGPLKVGTPFSLVLQAVGGTAPYQWLVDTTTLPPGLAFTGGNTISGTLTGAGEFATQVSVSDADGTTFSRTLTFSVGARSSGVTVAVLPASLSLGQSAVATVTVADTETDGTASSPTGTAAVTFNTVSGGTCTLVGAGPGASSCSVAAFTAPVAGTYTVQAVYTPGGTNPSHAGGSATATLTVTATPPPPPPPPAYRFTGFLSPLSLAGTIEAPSTSPDSGLGSAVPVKWQLRDPQTNAFISRLTTATLLRAVANTDCAGAPEPAAGQVVLYAPTSGATGNSTFRYDRKSNQFIFNWDTASAAGIGRGCYTVILELDDASPSKATTLRLK